MGEIWKVGDISGSHGERGVCNSLHDFCCRDPGRWQGAVPTFEYQSVEDIPRHCLDTHHHVYDVFAS